QRIADASLDIRGLAADGKEVVKRAGEDVDAILKNLREVSVDLKGIIARAGPKVDAILDDASQAARGAADLGREFTALAPRLHADLAKYGDAEDFFTRMLRAGGGQPAPVK